MTNQPAYKAILKPRRAMPFFARHPWVYAGAIRYLEFNGDRINAEDIAAGATVDLYSEKDEFIARGLYNSNSNIRLRLYTWNKDEQLDETFWGQRITEAISLRSDVLKRKASSDSDNNANARRIVFSEADGISGLTVDQYDQWLLVQFTSLALHKQSESILGLLQQKLQPKGIVQRSEKAIQDLEGMELTDGLIAGEEPPRPLFIHEDGIQIGVDVLGGQKTGYFLDQRDNRKAVAQYTSGHRVLDLFCYTGGFSLAAAKLGDAKNTLGIDSSESAINAAKANADLNDVGGKCNFQKSDVTAALDQFAAEGRVFDTIVVDPPKMARKRSGLDRAMRGYFNLNKQAIERLVPGGVFVTCSCSGLVTREDFEEMLSAVAQATGRDIQILEARGAAADHPVSITCPETEYLKCYICRA